MGTVYPDWRYPHIGSEDQTNVLLPTLASGIQSMASVTNHFIAMRAKRQVHHRVEYARDLANGQDSLLYQTPVGVSDTHRVWWRSHELSSLVLVSFVYQAIRAPRGVSAGTSVQVTATLKLHSTGVIIDAPDAASAACIWDAQRGLGFAGPNKVGDVNPAGAVGAVVNEYPFLVAHTGQTGDPVLSAPYPSSPRPIVIPSTDAGSWVRLELAASNVRVNSIDVWEIPANPTSF